MKLSNHMPLSEEIEDAISVVTHVCGCPHIHIVLCDEQEGPYARMIFTPAEFATFVRDIEEQLGHPLPKAPLHG